MSTALASIRWSVYRLTAWAAILLAASPAGADRFAYVDEQGKQILLEGRLLGTAEGVGVVELADGQYQFIPEKAARRRTVSEGPAPIDGAGMLAALEEQFTSQKFHGLAQDPYVLGLVLAAPLPKNGEGRASGFLHQAGVFLKNVDSAFGKFIKDARVPARPPRFPLVVLIFESQADFVQYATVATGGSGLSAKRLGGFYSPRTNFLAVRLDECRTYEVVLHEAIHQQTYNRELFQRLAPIPTWFQEGIATGFEANQGKISIGPGKISMRYATQAIESRRVTWEQLLTNDAVFQTDALASDAYGLGWGLHWLAVTKYHSEYGKYLRLLATKQPLTEDKPQQRLADFREAFGKAVTTIVQDFRLALEAGMKRQKVTREKPKPPPGMSQTVESLGEVQLSAVRHADAGPGRLEVQGALANLSPLRPMAFHVTVETDAALYAEWFVPSVEVAKSIPLSVQQVQKMMNIATPDGRIMPAPRAAGVPRRFRVRIRSTPAESTEAQAWRRGRLPVPLFGAEPDDEPQ